MKRGLCALACAAAAWLPGRAFAQSFVFHRCSTCSPGCFHACSPPAPRPGVAERDDADDRRREEKRRQDEEYRRNTERRERMNQAALQQLGAEMAPARQLPARTLRAQQATAFFGLPGGAQPKLVSVPAPATPPSALASEDLRRAASIAAALAGDRAPRSSEDEAFLAGQLGLALSGSQLSVLVPAAPAPAPTDAQREELSQLYVDASGLARQLDEQKRRRAQDEQVLADYSDAYDKARAEGRAPPAAPPDHAERLARYANTVVEETRTKEALEKKQVELRQKLDVVVHLLE